jgi:predicted phosphodiesterase
MTTIAPIRPFQPQEPDAADVVTWIHLGDLHMTRAGEQNHRDLARIVDEVNRAFAGSVSFVFLPGDVADDGSRTAYSVVRSELDRLKIPWCAIIGDHDVHEKSFANFLEAMAENQCYAFTVGAVRFVAMNAFDVPDPKSFAVSEEQLGWVRRELETATNAGQSKVLLLHCYPSDLKAGGTELMEAVRKFHVHLIDMGHTHYNEIANDGRTLYSATRSTGQVEEGPVGYSVTNLDGGVMSWRFVELGKLPIVVITSPGDERLLTSSGKGLHGKFKVRAKIWGEDEILQVNACFEGREMLMKRVADSQVWEAMADASGLVYGAHSLMVKASGKNGKTATDEIRVVIGNPMVQRHADRDQDTTLGAWPEHGLLGTQLGPNKNGKKW